tara:strand:+ start:657 stop:899 length:243 start_codon:yes stop_codon:yes gene_type:complete
MITLYALPTCPFCQKVRVKLEELGLEYTELNVQEEKHRDDLIERGGKKTTPYLVDDSTDTEMYESDDIVNYLEEEYGKKE